MVSGSPIIEKFYRATKKRSEQLQRPKSTAPSDSTGNCTTESISQESADVGSHNAPKNPSRRLHHVLSIYSRRLTVTWMRRRVAGVEDRLLASAKVKKFPEFFKGTASANHMRTRLLWKDLDTYPVISGYYNQGGTTSSLTSVTKNGFQRPRLKARTGSGRKR